MAGRPAAHSQPVGVARGWPARLGRTGVLSAAGRHGSVLWRALSGRLTTGQAFDSSKHHETCTLIDGVGSVDHWCSYRCTTITNLGRSCIKTAQIARLLGIINGCFSRGGSPCVLSPPGLDPEKQTLWERSTYYTKVVCADRMHGERIWWLELFTWVHLCIVATHCFLITNLMVLM